MERVYKLAMFPLDDADYLRDKLFNESVAKLAATVSPSHRSADPLTTYSG
mgnify:CR=1 FL=1